MNIWAIFGTAAVGLLMTLVQWMKEGQATRTGGELEAGRVNAEAARAAGAIAQAEAAAPRTQAGVVDTLNAGKF